MEDNYEYVMSESEYRTMMMKKEVKEKLDLEEKEYENVSELAESDYEVN